MVLHPLEFSECYLDSPWFRQSIQEYEEELERTDNQIKNLIKVGQNMLNASRMQTKLMTVFNDSLQNFQFDCIGQNLTDDEKSIAGSLREFGLMLEEIATEWSNTVDRAEIQLIKPLEGFRKDHIHSYRDSKKLFEKASERYYKQLEHTLGKSRKKKEQQLQDSDNEVLTYKKDFHKQSLSYVYKLQEVQERKKFQFVEYLLMFTQIYFNFFHQCHETANDCKDYMEDLQRRLVATREQYQETDKKTKTLMQQKEQQTEADQDREVQESSGKRWSRAGYLFLMEKNPISTRFTSKWTKYFCMYTKENKLFQMSSAYNPSSNATASAKSGGSRITSLYVHSSNSNASLFLEPMIVLSCVRRKSDSIDKRFCFDLELEDTGKKQYSFTFQAMSSADRKKWMGVMDGKEPNYMRTKVLSKVENQHQLNDIGIEFVRKLIVEIERRGLDYEGIYRLVGVFSKVEMLLKKGTNPSTSSNLDYTNEDEWETNTLTSALKSFFRKLPDPVLTFDLYRDFINAAMCETHEDRVARVVSLIKQLPESNKKILALLTEHLEKVQSYQKKNKMNVQNLGVCFGPTLMRDREETVQAILEIKFCNIVIEILIEERLTIFGSGSGVNKITEEERTPKRTTTKLSYNARLPSHRLKQRPRGFYDHSDISIPGVLEEESECDAFTRSKFSRGKAMRSYPLGKSSVLLQHKEITEEIPSSSDDEQMRNEKSSVLKYSPIKSKQTTHLGSARVSKEVWIPPTQPESQAAATAWKNRPKIPRSEMNESTGSGASGRSTSFGKSAKPLVHSDSVTKNQRISSTKPPVPQKRVGSFSRPKTEEFTTGHLKSTTVNSAFQRKNSNANNNTINDNLTKISSSPSIRTRKNILLANMDQGSSTCSSKQEPNNMSSERKVHQANVFPSSRSPKSCIIPNVFLAEEIGSHQHPKPRRKPQFRSDGENDSQTGRQEYSHVIKGVRKAPSPPHATTKDVVTSVDDDDVVVEEELKSSVARTLFDCRADDESELSFQSGQLIRDITNAEEPDWLRGVINGKAGLIPRNYVEFL